MRPLDEQTILVTGSTDGLGRAVAAELAGRGARVLVHGRDPAKVDAVADEIGAAGRYVADLSSLAEARRLASEVEQLDALVNNAGVYEEQRSVSADGVELTFAVNHLAHFLLTLLVLDKLREPARIVNVASLGQAPLDFDDLMYERDYQGFFAYAKSKLAQVMFTIDLAERLEGRDVTANSLHPATFMDTKMVRGGPATPMTTVDEGMRAVVRLLADPELDGVSGRFYDGVNEATPHEQAADPDARRRLWEESERLAGVT